MTPRIALVLGLLAALACTSSEDGKAKPKADEAAKKADAPEPKRAVDEPGKPDRACTEMGCTDTATIKLSRAIGPYKLALALPDKTINAGCASEDGSGSGDLDVTCFEDVISLTGELSKLESVTVTITPKEATAPLVDAVLVTFGPPEDWQPNGEGCPPTCKSREATLALDPAK